MLGLALAVPAVAVRLRRTGTLPPPFGVSRPPVALTEFWNLWGVSTTFGVGAPKGFNYPQQLRGPVTSEVMGQALHHGGPAPTTGLSYVGNGGYAAQTTPQIVARVSACASGYPAEMVRPQAFSGGLNNHNSVSTGFSITLGYGRNWPALAKSDLAAETAAVSGGKAWFHILAPSEDLNSDGMPQGANHVTHRRDLIAAHGARVLNFQRYARDHAQASTAGSSTKESSGPDWFSAQVNGTVPLSLRGGSASDIAYNDTPAIIGSSAPSDLTTAEGQVYFNSVSTTTYVKVGGAGAGSWATLDTKHFSTAGYALMARMVADAMMAAQGSGPPFASLQELLCRSDLADGATLGTIVFGGSATAAAITTDRAGTVPSLRWQIGTGGVVTRIPGAPPLSEGMHTVYVWLTNSYGSLRSVPDIYVDKPAGAPPRRFLTSGTGVALFGASATASPTATASRAQR